MEGGVARTVRYAVEIAAALVQAAGPPTLQAQAVQNLTNTKQDAEKTGMAAYKLEASLALAQIETARGEKMAGRRDLELVGREASAKGFGLIAKKASQAN
jgi:hypothetical protein